jgi:hypothetical protein
MKALRPITKFNSTGKISDYLTPLKSSSPTSGTGSFMMSYSPPVHQDIDDTIDITKLFSLYRFPFEDVFDHPVCRQQFKQHLQQLQNEESLIFYEIVEEYKIMKSERNRYNTAIHLMKTFIEPRSDFELNLPQKVRQECIDNFKQCNVNNCSELLFDKICMNIFLQLKTDAYPRWNNSNTFKKFVVNQLKKERNLLDIIAVKSKTIDNNNSNISVTRPHWLTEIDKMNRNKQKKKGPLGKMKAMFSKSAISPTATDLSNPHTATDAITHVDYIDVSTEVEYFEDSEDEATSSDNEDNSDPAVVEQEYKGMSSSHNEETIWDIMEEDEEEKGHLKDEENTTVIQQLNNKSVSKQINLTGELENELELANLTNPMIRSNDFQRVRDCYQLNQGWTKREQDNTRKDQHIDIYYSDESYGVKNADRYATLRRVKHCGIVPISIDKAMEYLGSTDGKTDYTISNTQLLAFLKQIDDKEDSSSTNDILLDQLDDSPRSNLKRPLIDKICTNINNANTTTATNSGHSTNVHAVYVTLRNHKYPWPVKDRSFIVSQSAVCDDAEDLSTSRRYIIFSKSTDFDQSVAKEEKIRAKVVQSIVLEEYELTKCRYTVTSWYDMCGWFPYPVFNKVAKKQAYRFHDQLYGLVWNDHHTTKNNNNTPCLHDTLEYYSLLKGLRRHSFVTSKIHGLQILSNHLFDPYAAIQQQALAGTTTAKTEE